MRDAGAHDITSVPMESGVPTEPVPVETLRSGLRSDDPGVRSQAATVAAGLSGRDPETVADVVPALIDRLGDDQRVAVYQSAFALSQVALETADQLDRAVAPLVDLCAHDLPLVRMVAARTLGALAVERPRLLVDHVPALVEALSEEPGAPVDVEEIRGSGREPRRLDSLQTVNRKESTRQVYARNVTVNLLVEVAKHEPGGLRPHVDVITDLLGDEDAHVARGCAELLEHVAEEDPDAVAGAVDPLVSMLDHGDTAVAATAVRALARIGDPAAVEPLRDLAAASDRDEDLTDLAGEVADVLDR